MRKKGSDRMKDTLIGWTLAVLIPCALFAGVHVQSGDNTGLGNVTMSTATVTGPITGSTVTLTGQMVFPDGTVINSTTSFSSSSFDPMDATYAYFIDDFPCKNVEDGEVGTLGWQLVNTITGTSCGGQTQNTGIMSMIPGTGNLLCGITLARSGGTDSSVLTDPENNDFEFKTRFRIADIGEVVYKIGLGDEPGTESNDAYTTSQAFIGAVFKNETVDSSNECGGVGGSSTTWNALIRNGVNTSSGVNTGVTASIGATDWFWVRVKSTATPGIQVCVEQTTGFPTWPSGNCYEETTTNRFPTGELSPIFGVSSCDNTTISGNNNLILVDYMALKVERIP